jgi:5-methylthioadenosine/S-adenosylhomocysteine deaminase
VIHTSARDSRVAWHARWVLPIVAAPLRDAAVVVDGERIVWVGPSAQAEAGRHEQLGEAILMPGLINAHTHLELTSLRGFLEGLPFRDWLRVLTDVRANVLDARALGDAARFGVSEALRAGITTVADCSASGAPLDAIADAGMRGRVYLETFGPDAAQVSTSMQALRDGVTQLRARATSLVDVGVSPHAPYTVSAPLFRAVAQYARDERLPVATHVAESAAEVDFVRHGTGPFADRLLVRGIAVAGTQSSPIALLAECGMLDAQPLCIHAIHADAHDLQRLVDAGATVVHCPISNAKLGQGIAPLRAMLDAGIAVGLGTDSVASNDRMDLIAEARQAVLLQSVATSTPDAMCAADALHLATRGGAQALGLAEVGTLAPGQWADLCAFHVDAFEAAPVYDPQVLLVHVLGSGARAALTMVAGRVLVRDGIELAFDDAIRARVMDDGAAVQQYTRARPGTGG